MLQQMDDQDLRNSQDTFVMTEFNRQDKINEPIRLLLCKRYEQFHEILMRLYSSNAPFVSYRKIESFDFLKMREADRIEDVLDEQLAQFIVNAPGRPRYLEHDSQLVLHRFVRRLYFDKKHSLPKCTAVLKAYTTFASKLTHVDDISEFLKLVLQASHAIREEVFNEVEKLFVQPEHKRTSIFEIAYSKFDDQEKLMLELAYAKYLEALGRLHFDWTSVSLRVLDKLLNFPCQRLVNHIGKSCINVTNLKVKDQLIRGKIIPDFENNTYVIETDQLHKDIRGEETIRELLSCIYAGSYLKMLSQNPIEITENTLKLKYRIQFLDKMLQLLAEDELQLLPDVESFGKLVHAFKSMLDHHKYKFISVSQGSHNDQFYNFKYISKFFVLIEKLYAKEEETTVSQLSEGLFLHWVRVLNEWIIYYKLQNQPFIQQAVESIFILFFSGALGENGEFDDFPSVLDENSEISQEIKKLIIGLDKFPRSWESCKGFKRILFGWGVGVINQTPEMQIILEKFLASVFSNQNTVASENYSLDFFESPTISKVFKKMVSGEVLKCLERQAGNLIKDGVCSKKHAKYFEYSNFISKIAMIIATKMPFEYIDRIVRNVYEIYINCAHVWSLLGCFRLWILQIYQEPNDNHLQKRLAEVQEIFHQFQGNLDKDISDNSISIRTSELFERFENVANPLINCMHLKKSKQVYSEEFYKRYFSFILHVEEKNREWGQYWAQGENQYRSWVTLGVNLQYELSKIRTELKLNIRYYLCNSTKLLNYNEEDIILRQISTLYMKVLLQNGLKMQIWKLLNSILGFNERNYKTSLLQSKQLLGNHHRYTSRFNPALKIDDFAPFNFFSCLYSYIRPHFPALLKVSFDAIISDKDNNEIIWQNLQKILFMPVNISGSCLFNGKHHSKSKQEMVFGIYGQQYKILSDILTQIKEGSKTNITIVLQLQKRSILSKLFDTVKLKTTKIVEKARNLENMNRFRARQQSPEQIFQSISQLGIPREYFDVALRNVEVPDENQILNWIDNHSEQLEAEVLNQALYNSSGVQRRGSSQPPPQEKSGNSIQQLNLQSFKKEINGAPLKNWVRFIFKELFQNISMEQIYKIKDILFMFLQFFEPTLKIKQLKNLNDKIYNDLDALNKETNIKLKLSLLISIMETLSDKYTPSKSEFYKRSINMKALSFLDRLTAQQDQAKIFGLINTYLPVITPQLLSPQMQVYLEYLLDITLKFKIADKNITQIFLKIAKSNKQTLIERITRNIVEYLATGLISQNIVPIIQIIFESDKELSLVNAELDLKSYIYERYLHVINSFHPEKEHLIEVDGAQLAQNFSKYEKDSAIYEVSKKILKKKKNKNRVFCYDCRKQQNAFDYSSFLKAPFIAARLKGYQQTIVRSLISILVNSTEAQQQQFLIQLHKILGFYRILIPFALKQRVNSTNLLEWLINTSSSNKRKYKLLIFLCLNNNIFIRANEDSLYSFYSIADYSCSRIIETLASRKYEPSEYHAIISCLYLQQVKRFSNFSEVQFGGDNSQNLVSFLEKLIVTASPVQQLVLSQILTIQYNKRLINNLKRKYKVALSQKQPTFTRQFLSLSSFYSSLAMKTTQLKTSKYLHNPIVLPGRWSQQRQNSQSDQQQGNEERPMIFQLNDGGLEYPGRRALIGAEPDLVEQFLVPIFKKDQKEKEVDPTQLVPIVKTYNFTILQIINRFEKYLDFSIQVPEKFNVPQAAVPQNTIKVSENVPFKIVIPEGSIDIDIRVNKNFNFQKRFTDLTKILNPTSSWEQKKIISPQERRFQEISRRIFAQDPNMTLEYRHEMLQQLERLVANRQNRLGQQPPQQQQARLLNINEIYSQSAEFTEAIRPVLPPKEEKMVIEEPIKVEQVAESKIIEEVKVVQNQQIVEQIPILPVVNNPPAEHMEIEEPVQLAALDNIAEIPQNAALIIQQQVPMQIQQPQQALLIIPPEPEDLIPQIDRQILRVFDLPQTFLRDAGIDQMAFDCLPEELQQEQLMEIIRQNRAPDRNPPPNRNPGQEGQQANQEPADHENVIFLAGLDYETRIQVLLQANPQFLATLPVAIRQQAQALRNHQISRLIDEEDLREEEKRVQIVKQKLKIPPPKIYKQQFSPINEDAAKKIFEGVLFIIPNFKISALKILLENKQTQSKAIMSIIGFLRYLQAIKNKKLYRLRKILKQQKTSRIIQTFDWSQQDITNIRLFLLHTVYEAFKLPIYQHEDFLAQSVKKQFYLEELASFFGEEEIIDPKIQLLEHSLRYYPALSCQLIKKLKDLPDHILKRLVQAMKTDTLPQQFYPNLENFSDNERLKLFFAAAFENDKPKIQILGKVLKYNFSHLPHLKKIHEQALEYFSNSYYQFLNQIFRIYTLQSLVDIEPILTKHKQIHFQVIKYLLQANKEIDKQPIGILLKKPHLLDFETKKFIFRNHPKIRKLSRHRVHIEVDRTHIFQGSYNQLMSRSIRELQGRIQVSFLNEAGYDAGGLKRQWFLIVSREIFNQDYALFEKSSSGSTYQPNPKSYVNPDHLNYFKFIGRFIGKALVQRQLIDAYFTRAFYKIILGQQLQFKDLQAQDYEFFKSMEWLKNNPIDADMFTFSYFYDNFGNKIQKELVPGGKSIIVNEQNKKEFIEKYCLAKMRDDFSAQINKFLQGFYEIIPQQCISFFEAKQLQLLMSGVPEVDVQDLKKNTDYSGYNPTDQIIIWFWEVVEEYSQESLAKLVQFITGTSKIPVEGFSQLVGMNGIQRISIHRDPNEHQLPKSHTCFNQLDLPNYATKEILREKMAICLAWGSEGFGFM